MDRGERRIKVRSAEAWAYLIREVWVHNSLGMKCWGGWAIVSRWDDGAAAYAESGKSELDAAHHLHTGALIGAGIHTDQTSSLFCRRPAWAVLQRGRVPRIRIA